MATDITDDERSKIQIKDAPKSYRSTVWKSFGFREGQLNSDKVICKLCYQDVPYKHGNTSNLNTHLKRKHGLDGKEDKTKVGISDSADDASKVKQPKLDDFVGKKFAFSSVKSKKITYAVAAFIACDMRPYSVVENIGFRHLLATLEPRYHIPSRTHIAESVIPKLYDTVRDRIKSELKQAQSIAITTDTWTSRATKNYMAVTAHFVDEDWKVKSYTLQTKVFHESHTAENLSQALTNTISDWQLQRNGKPPAISTDNASNIVKAVHLAGLTHNPCFAHTLNLATQRSLAVNEMDRLLGRVRRIVAFFHRSTTASAVLKTKQSLLGLGQKKLIIDVSTRWNSSFDMLVRYIEQQAAIFATLLEKNVKKNATTILTLSDQDNRNLESIVQVLGPMKTATTTMCSSRNPTVSLIHPLKERLLQELKIQPGDNTLIQNVKTAIVNDLLSRYTDQDTAHFLMLSTALDLRFKSLPYLTQEEKDVTYQLVQQKAIKTVELPVQVKQEQPDNQLPDDGPGAPDQPDLPALPDEADAVDEPVHAEPGDHEEKHSLGPELEKGGDLDALFGDVFICHIQPAKSTEERVKGEIQAYKAELSPPVSSEPLQWWKDRCGSYPLLSKVAVSLLSVPATSVESERVFSTAGDIVSHQRATLSADNVDQTCLSKEEHDHSIGLAPVVNGTTYYRFHARTFQRGLRDRLLFCDKVLTN